MTTSQPTKHGAGRIALRYLAGRPLDGRRRTDCTFLRPGTVKADPLAHPTRWSYLPGWKRTAWRLGVPGSLILSATAYAEAPVPTELGLGALTVYGVSRTGHRTYTRVRNWQHTRTYVQPLAVQLGRQLGYPDTHPYSEWLTVPRTFAAPDYTHDPDDPDDGIDLPDSVRLAGEIIVRLPVQLPDTPDIRTAIQRTVSAKLGIQLQDLDARWALVGREPEARFRVAPRPPKRVTLKTVRDMLEAAPESAPILGIGRRGKPVAVDLDAESPHILISAGTGGGKSVQTRAIVAQLMRHGAQVVFLDVKRRSHLWAKDLPGVIYCRDDEEVHDQLIALAAEGDRRNRLTDDLPGDVDVATVDVGPRVVLVAEEMNATIGKLQRYWDEIREKSDPKVSPAVRALGEILFMGRAVKIHVIAIAQMMTARTLGGPEARENFATRILGRYTVNAWRMLVPEIWPPPKASRHAGRVQVVLGGQARETQVLFLSESEAREWASSAGDVTVPVTWETDHDLRDSTKIVTSAGRWYTLAEAARQEWCTLGYDALRQRKQRAGEKFPTGRTIKGQQRWSEAELRAFLGPVDTETGADVNQETESIS